MEEVRQETQNRSGKLFSVSMVIIAISLAIYFLFPVFILYPLSQYYPPYHTKGFLAAIKTVFYPMTKIGDCCFQYRLLIKWEWHLFGIEVQVDDATWDD